MIVDGIRAAVEAAGAGQTVMLRVEEVRLLLRAADAVALVVDQCEAAFEQLGMSGPDPVRMGRVWCDAYVTCRNAISPLRAAKLPLEWFVDTGPKRGA